MGGLEHFEDLIPREMPWPIMFKRYGERWIDGEGAVREYHGIITLGSLPRWGYDVIPGILPRPRERSYLTVSSPMVPETLAVSPSISWRGHCLWRWLFSVYGKCILQSALLEIKGHGRWLSTCMSQQLFLSRDPRKSHSMKIQGRNHLADADSGIYDFSGLDCLGLG